MKYDLSCLKDLQKELDNKICKKHNINSDETVTSRILAFLVEVGELANETRCFKYWSIKEASPKNVIIEEYSDGIHFLVSLSNYFELDIEFNLIIDETMFDLTSQFIRLYECATTFANNLSKSSLLNLWEVYLILGHLLGFDQNEIIDAYLKKNKTNHNRQENNY